MIIYKDNISEDELFSDIYPMELIHNNTVWQVKGKLTTQSTDMGSINIGANASAEEADEGTDEHSISGVNIVLANRLVETQFGKKDYQVYIKGYMTNIKKQLEEKRPDDVSKFMEGATAFVKSVLKEFKEYQFFMGEKTNAEGMIALLKWDDETPVMYFFKDGLDAEKV